LLCRKSCAWGLELRFLLNKDNTEGSLDLFEMTVQPNARMPIAHHHESWDETIYGPDGVTTWRIGGHDVMLEPGQTFSSSVGWCTASATTRRCRRAVSAS
jgi:uncharacterized cupin superfamily protein